MLAVIGINFSDLKEESRKQLLEMIGKSTEELGWDDNSVIASLTILAKER